MTHLPGLPIANVTSGILYSSHGKNLLSSRIPFPCGTKPDQTLIAGSLPLATLFITARMQLVKSDGAHLIWSKKPDSWDLWSKMKENDSVVWVSSNGLCNTRAALPSPRTLVCCTVSLELASSCLVGPQFT